MSRILVAYFSATGVTAKAAVSISQALEAPCYEICPVTPYTKADLNWMNPFSRSTKEMKGKHNRPPLGGEEIDLAPYDTVLLGFPIWWYREPSLIDSFLDVYDLSGKTVVPFFTSGGSGLGEGQDRIAKLAKGARVLPGKRFSARADERELKSWIAGLNLT